MGKQTGRVTSEIVFKSLIKLYNLVTNTNTDFQYY